MIDVVKGFTQTMSTHFIQIFIGRILHRGESSWGGGGGGNPAIPLNRFGSLQVLPWIKAIECLQLAKHDKSSSHYSGTSHNGLSEIRTASIQQTNHVPPNDFTIELIHFQPPRYGQSLNSGQSASENRLR